MSSENNKQVLEKVKVLKDDVAVKAEHIISVLMPGKIIKLDNLYKIMDGQTIPASEETAIFSIEKLESVKSEILAYTNDFTPATKKRKADEVELDEKNAGIPCNKVIVEILKCLKIEILQLIEYCNTIKMWIQLNIPRIEDGNNFGVSIQEDAVNELSRAEDSGFSILESITKYYVSRGKLISKIIKYPQIEDYRQCVVELDEKEYINLRLCCVDLRNNYAILHDLISKNLEKIKKPRSSHSSHNSMY